MSPQSRSILRGSYPTSCRWLRFFFYCLILGCIAPTVGSAEQNSPRTVAAPSPENLEISVQTEGPIPVTVHKGKSFDWRIVIRWFGEVDSVVPELKNPPTFEGLHSLSSSTTIRTGVESNRRFVEKIFSYRLVGEREGEATIGSAAIEYRTEKPSDHPILSTNRQMITLLPEPFSLKKVIARWSTVGTAQVAAASALVLIGMSVTLHYWNRSRKTVLPVETEPTKSPCETALDTAYRFRVEGDIQEYIRTLEKAVRWSFEAQFPEAKPAALEGYRSQIATERLPIFERFIQFCEEAKYTPIAPSPDLLNRAMEDVKNLIGMR